METLPEHMLSCFQSLRLFCKYRHHSRLASVAPTGSDCYRARVVVKRPHRTRASPHSTQGSTAGSVGGEKHFGMWIATTCACADILQPKSSELKRSLFGALRGQETPRLQDSSGRRSEAKRSEAARPEEARQARRCHSADQQALGWCPVRNDSDDSISTTTIKPETPSCGPRRASAPPRLTDDLIIL